MICNMFGIQNTSQYPQRHPGRLSMQIEIATYDTRTSTKNSLIARHQFLFYVLTVWAFHLFVNNMMLWCRDDEQREKHSDEMRDLRRLVRWATFSMVRTKGVCCLYFLCFPLAGGVFCCLRSRFSLPFRRACRGSISYWYRRKTCSMVRTKGVFWLYSPPMCALKILSSFPLWLERELKEYHPYMEMRIKRSRAPLTLTRASK
jgi:hypothetical protein